ncbi:microtubule-associated protein futsch isoform X2 [Pungitius pungitius]|uniref:microtubule-associated protein futsch isoform X2 n=1 Tax=Pungitius pungitius TaxID=134920 RepID=UPI002E0D5932
MKFPVDLLASVSQTELESLAHNYMNNLLYSNPDSPEHLILSDSTQVTINISSVGFTPLYGSGDRQMVLALFSPSNPFTAVALFLLDRWWTVDDILKTADTTRGGTVEVKSLGERIVLYILNRIVYRAKEMSSEELPFLCHGEKDYAKILWNNGEAVGFYSVKPAGSFCSSFSTSSYQLPVMDSLFIRKHLRRQGFGLQMLKDFVLSFREDCLGLRYPLTQFMYKVCEKYLCQYPGDTDILWEVKSIGGPKQRTNIFKKLRAMNQRKSLVITERMEKEVLEAVSTQIKDSIPVECTVEIVEEATALSATKEAEVPLTACSSSGSKQRKIGEEKTEKAIRIEDIEAEDISAQEKTELQVSNLMKADGTSTVACEEQGEHTLDQPSTVLSQRDLEEAGVTLAPTSEEPQVEDGAPQNLNSNFCDSQITVENVASEIREEFQQEEETLEHVGEGTQVGVPDEKSEERVTQQEPTVSTRATSENIVTGKTGGANVRAVIAVDHVTTTRRSTQHSKQEDVGTTLRRSIRNTLPSTLKYPLHSQKVSEESEKEPADVEELVEESAVAEREPQDEEETSIEEDVVAVKELSEETQQLEDEQPKSEEQMVEDSQPPDTATKECQDEVVSPKTKKEQKGELQTSVIQNETQEPPAEASAGDKKAEEKEAYKQMAQEGTVQKAKEAAVDIIPLTEEHTVSKICKNSEADIPVEDSAEGNLPLAEVDEAVKLEDNIDNKDNIDVENEDVVQSIAVVTAAAEDLAPEEAGTPLPSPATHSAVLPSVKDGGTPSAEEQQSEEMANQFSSLRKLTVVLMDLQKPNHGVQDVTEAKEGNIVQKTAAKAEGELRERTMEDEDTVAQENVAMDITTTEKEALEDESTIVEVSKAEVGEPMTNLEEGERLEERDPTEGDKNIEAEEAVNQHHAQEEGPIDDEEKTMYVAEETVAKRDTVKGETSTSTPEVVESVQQIMLTAKDGQVEDVSEEDAPVVERVLRSGGKTTRSKTTTKHDDAKVEKRTEEGEPAASIRVLRKGRKPADGATKPKSKRAHTMCQGEREEDDECALPDVAQEEETIALLEETDKKEESTDEKIEENNANEDAPQDEGNTEPELCNVPEAVSGESLTDQETVGEKESAAEAAFGERAEETPNIDKAKVSDAEEALSVKSGEEAVRAISRKGRRSAAAAPGHKAKRARTQCQQEEVGEEEAPPAVVEEEKEAGQESPEDKAIEREEMVKDKDVEEEEYTVGDAEQTKDASTREEDDRSVEAVSGSVNIPSPSAEDEETTVVGQQKASPRSKRQNDDSTRRSVRKRPKVNYQENEEGERDKGGTDEEEEVTVAFDGDHGNKTAQCSSETAKEAEAAGSSKVGEEEKEEPVVIGKRVLRGRSVPSVTITPQSRSRRRSVKVSKENSPRSAHKRKGRREFRTFTMLSLTKTHVCNH